jgi:hypothetical protein
VLKNHASLDAECLRHLIARASFVLAAVTLKWALALYRCELIQRGDLRIALSLAGLFERTALWLALGINRRCNNVRRNARSP